MPIQQTLGLFEHLTHKANLKHTRYGWLRLTPAYSVHLVSDLLDAHCAQDSVVLDPFSGTGTTALVCAERGITAYATDINPFLRWLATAKTRTYSHAALQACTAASERVVEALASPRDKLAWTPPLFQIEKWWDADSLLALSRALHCIQEGEAARPAAATDLLKAIFCRTMIEQAHVSFGHQSMSFKKSEDNHALFHALHPVISSWQKASRDIQSAAQSQIQQEPSVLLCDARQLTQMLRPNTYTCVITSPPYPNRMSYVRELRPYLYWLGYLQDGRQAGELDWQAIGGTWGCATSNVGKWVPACHRPIPYADFSAILNNIAERSPLLSRYVHKYFYDMVEHARELFAVVKPGGTIHYIVGNSKFYDVLLPVEEIFAALFRDAGFAAVQIETIRKRTSKKELYEYVVSAHKPG